MMKCSWKTLLALICIVGGAPHGRAATTDTQRFEGKTAAFTIQVPTNWVEMNPRIYGAMVDPYAPNNSLESSVTRFSYGPPRSETDTNPPSIAVAVRKSGRMNDIFMALQSNEGFFKTNLTRRLQQSGILERDLLEMSYDPDRQAARFSFLKQAPLNRGQLRVTQQTFFTEEGAINVAAICPGSEWNSWSNSIESTLESFQVADRLRYQPRSADELRPRLSGITALVVTVCVFVMGPIAYMIYNRKAGEVMSDEI